MAATRASKLLLLLGFLGVSSAPYLDDFQAQASNQFPVNANGGHGSGFFGGSGGGFGGGDGIFGDSDPVVALGNAIGGDGIPGVDYPILATVPETSFVCSGLLPGYYADTVPEAGCQVFHICQGDGRIDSFLCPNGTVFNQQYFVCDWWYNFDCSLAEEFYAVNAEIGKTDDDQTGSASSLQSSYSAPGHSYGFGSSVGRLVGSASSLQGSYSAPGHSNGFGSSSNGLVGSVSSPQGLTAEGRTPSALYTIPNHNTNGATNNSLGAGTSPQVSLVRPGNRNGSNRNGGSNGRTPSSLYQTPGK